MSNSFTISGKGKFLWATPTSTVWDVRDEEGQLHRVCVKQWVDIHSTPILEFDPEGGLAYVKAEEETEESQAKNSSGSSASEAQVEERLQEGEEDR